MIDIVRGSIDQYIYNQFITADSVALQELKSQGVKIMKFPTPVLERLRQLSEQYTRERGGLPPCQFSTNTNGFRYWMKLLKSKRGKLEKREAEKLGSCPGTVKITMPLFKKRAGAV